MEPDTAIIVGTFLTRLFTIAVGASALYMGFQLFCRGILEPTADITAAWKDSKLLIRRAAPGVSFALFGAVMTAIACWKPISYERSGTRLSNQFPYFKMPLDKSDVPLLQKILEGNALNDDEKAVIKGMIDRAESVTIHAFRDLP